jgi:hypothetical protein
MFLVVSAFNEFIGERVLFVESYVQFPVTLAILTLENFSSFRTVESWAWILVLFYQLFLCVFAFYWYRHCY